MRSSQPRVVCMCTYVNMCRHGPSLVGLEDKNYFEKMWKSLPPALQLFAILEAQAVCCRHGMPCPS